MSGFSSWTIRADDDPVAFGKSSKYRKHSTRDRSSKYGKMSHGHDKKGIEMFELKADGRTHVASSQSKSNPSSYREKSKTASQYSGQGCKVKQHVT